MQFRNSSLNRKKNTKMELNYLCMRMAKYSSFLLQLHYHLKKKEDINQYQIFHLKNSKNKMTCIKSK